MTVKTEGLELLENEEKPVRTKVLKDKIVKCAL
jgi:hypothetical protein